MKHNIPFVTGEFYHVFNRANSQTDKLFFQERNYVYFLEKWEEYLGVLLEVWAYCLMPNHFHFLVRVKIGDNREIKEQMRRFAICFAQAINKQEKRRGSLFQEHPKGVLIQTEAHLLWLMYYIHNNPVHHGLTRTSEQWKYSSLKALSGTMKTKLVREKVWGMFGSRDSFLAFHKQQQNYKDIGYCLLDSSQG